MEPASEGLNSPQADPIRLVCFDCGCEFLVPDGNTSVGLHCPLCRGRIPPPHPPAKLATSSSSPILLEEIALPDEPREAPEIVLPDDHRPHLLAKNMANGEPKQEPPTGDAILDALEDLGFKINRYRTPNS